MYVGGIIMGLLSIGATVGGAAAGAHYAKPNSKTAGAALGAGAGIAASILASAFYAAAVADTSSEKKEIANVSAARRMGVAGPFLLPARVGARPPKEVVATALGANV